MLQKQRLGPPTAEEHHPEVARTSLLENVARLKDCEYSGLPDFHRSGRTKVWQSGIGRLTTEEFDPEVVRHTCQPQNIAKLRNCKLSGATAFDCIRRGVMTKRCEVEGLRTFRQPGLVPRQPRKRHYRWAGVPPTAEALGACTCAHAVCQCMCMCSHKLAPPRYTAGTRANTCTGNLFCARACIAQPLRDKHTFAAPAAPCRPKRREALRGGPAQTNKLTQADALATARLFCKCMPMPIHTYVVADACPCRLHTIESE